MLQAIEVNCFAVSLKRIQRFKGKFNINFAEVNKSLPELVAFTGMSILGENTNVLQLAVDSIK